MLQSSRAMRKVRILLALMGLSAGALAQTNPPEIRTLSLEDCLAIAIRHNLDVQIKRYNPEISRFNLRVLQGAYDSSMYLSVQHDDNQQPGGSDSQGRPVPGLKIETDSYSGGLQGLLPWGLSYNLGMSLADQTSSRPGTIDTNTTYFTNTFLDLTTGNSVTFVGTNFPSSSPASSKEIFSGSAGFLQLRQPLLKNFWIDDNRLQIYLDRKDLEISELDLSTQVSTTVTDVATAYY